MNRKLLKFVLSGALLFGCVGMLSSCKDTNEDQFAVLESEDVALQDQLNKATARMDQLQGLIDQLRSDLDNHLKNHPAGCTCDLTSITNRIDAVEKILNDSHLSEAGNVAQKLLDLETRLQKAETALEKLKDCPQLLEIADVENLQKVLAEKYNCKTLPEALSNLIDRVAALEAQEIPADLTEKVEGLEEQVSALQEAFGVWEGDDDVATAIQKINEAIEAQAEELQGQIDAIVESVAGQISDLQGSVNNLYAEVQKILEADYQGQIDAINEVLNGLDDVYAKIEDLKALENRLNSIINSIVIQQVTNKVFGSLMLPLGIQTNILMAYHGYNQSGISEFPSVRTAYEYNAEKGFSVADLAGVEKYNLSQVILDEASNNAGNVFFTVNPSNVDLTNATFSLVNSLDYNSGITLGTPVPCDKLLLYGWTRANNGFYWADANLAEENIDKCTLSIGDELKKEIASTAKEFLKDLRHMDRPDLSQIAGTIKNVLQKLNGKVAANAIKGEYQYTDLDGKTVKAATYSNYGIAALTIQPQSFCFLEGMDNKFDKLPTLPTIGDFEFEVDKVNINLTSDFKVNGLDVKLTFENITFNAEDLTVTASVTIDGKEYPVDTTVTGLDNIANSINAQLASIIGQVNDDVIAQVNAMVADINKQVNDMLESMSAQVNDQINDLLGDLSDEVNGQLEKYTDRLNNLIGKANRLLARVNRMLANPNRYLQPVVLYTGGQDLHVLSTSRVAPSKFYMNGGDATTLYFTSYTLETIAPAFKKYVKVVNAWKNGDPTRATVASAINKVNEKGNLDEVISGNQVRFAFAPEAGYTYEIVFQAIDYQGYTSTRRCFIEVQ